MCEPGSEIFAVVREGLSKAMSCQRQVAEPLCVRGQAVGQCSRASGFRSSAENRASSGERVRSDRERFRSSNLVVEQTAPTEPFGVNGGDLKVGAAAHHGCSKPLEGWPFASVGVISGSLLSSSPTAA